MWKINVTYEFVCEPSRRNHAHGRRLAFRPRALVAFALGHVASTPPPRAGSARLDALLDLPCAELERLYVDARAPRIGQVEGDLRGRMLAWPSLESRPRDRREPSAPSRARPRSRGAARASTRAPRTKARASTACSPIAFASSASRRSSRRSRAGDFDALQLDYDLPGNPPVIRSIKDEIRELEPGLWLGQAWLKTKKREILWLYFALARADAGV